MKTYYHFYLKKYQKKLHVVFWLVGLLFISCTSADEYDSVDYINLPLVKFSDTSLKIRTINYPDVPLTEVLDSGLGALKISGFLKTRIEIIDNKAKKYSFICSPLTKNYSQTDINDNYHEPNGYLILENNFNYYKSLIYKILIKSPYSSFDKKYYLVDSLIIK